MLFLLLVLILLGCAQPDLTAHWQCQDGSYQRSPEGCFQNVCTKDQDCHIAFYDGPCGATKGAFPHNIIPPRYEPKRCAGDQCSILMPGCIPQPMNVLIATCPERKCVSHEKEHRAIQLKDTIFSVAIAETEEEREHGLMHVRAFRPDEGMLFLFERPGRPAFWMKNTIIPLDILFLDADQRVATIFTVVPCTKEPCETYAPTRDITAVLEVQAGTAARLGIREGDRAQAINTSLH
ncbi:DUF192 domain-containing protein [Candidatus Woesearchaeota archaeon]|nr:DUF192 domain-containing protein [Candidatus Woesearchaeota archaeon]